MKKLYLIIAMAIFGSIGIFRNLLPLSSGEIALWRAVLAILVIGAVLLFQKKKLHFKQFGRELLLLCLSGAMMGFNWILLFESYRYTTVAISTLSYYFAPVLVMVISPFLFKEKIGAKGILCFIFSTLGLALVILFGDNSGGSAEHLKGVLFGLSAAVLYAGVVLINKFIKKVEGIERTFLQFVSAVIVLLPFVLITQPIGVFALDLKHLLILLVVGFLHTGLAYCMYFSSIKDVSGQEVAILSYIDPLVAVVLSVAVLNEPLNFWQIVGGAMILGFTLLNEIKWKK